MFYYTHEKVAMRVRETIVTIQNATYNDFSIYIYYNNYSESNKWQYTKTDTPFIEFSVSIQAI